MEGIIIIALAVFLLTSAGERDTRTVKKPIAADPRTRAMQTVHTYRQPGGYEKVDSWRLRSFIKRFQPKFPDYQIDTYANLIIKYSKVYDLDPKLIAGLIARESSFNPKAKSSTGALGLGQIKPFNFPELGIKNPYDPEQNIKGIAIMMRDLINKWVDHKEQVKFALASYKEGYYGVKKAGKYTLDTKMYIEDILKFQRELS